MIASFQLKKHRNERLEVENWKERPRCNMLGEQNVEINPLI